MIRPELENDLLALIEGRLPADRVPAVRAALTADPALARLVEGMRRDRDVLRREGAVPVASGPSLVQGALAMAERQALLDDSPDIEAARLRRAATRRVLAAAACLALVPVVAAIWIMASNQHRGAGERADRPSTGFRAPILPKLAQGDAAPAEPVEPRATPDELAEAARALLDEARESPVIARRTDAETPGPSLPEGLFGDGSDGAADVVADAHNELDPALVDRALTLAREGRLHVLARCDSPDAARARLSRLSGEPGDALAWRAMSSDSPGVVGHDLAKPIDASAAGPVGAAPVEPEANARGDFEVTLSLSADSDVAARAAVLDMLEALRSRIGPDGVIEVVEAPQGDAPRPSMHWRDVLWWGQPTANWQARLVTRVPVRLEASETSSGR